MNIEIDIKNCIEQLKAGEVICYPTDTVWGLGCDATNENAVKKIFELKKRSESKSLVILVSDVNMLSKYVHTIPSAAIDVIEYTTSPTTIIYDRVLGIAANAIAQDGSCAIRIASDDFCKKLIHQFKRPIVSTSANISNEDTPKFYKEISSEVLLKCAYVVQYRRGDTTPQKPSSIIKIKNNNEVTIIRK